MGLSNEEVDRAAHALVQAKGLWWKLLPEDWRKEVRKQAILALTAAADPNWKPEPMPGWRTEKWMGRADKADPAIVVEPAEAV